eukprot:Gb_20606 [translate_table: standard]
MSHRRQRYGIVMAVCALANAVLFIMAMYLNNCSGHSEECILPFLKRFSFEPLARNPLLGPMGSSLAQIGALQSQLVIHHKGGWRMLSCIWMSSGLVQLLINYMALFTIGIQLEKNFGSLRAAAIYLISGFAGSVLSAIFVESQYIVGSSGGICGLIGSTVASLIVNWGYTRHRTMTFTKIICLFGLYLCFGLTPHIDNFCHFGGFGMGFALGLALLMTPKEEWSSGDKESLPDEQCNSNPIYKYTALQRMTQFFALLLCIVALAAALGVLYRQFKVSAKCTASYCKYFTCMPSTIWSC